MYPRHVESDLVKAEWDKMNWGHNKERIFLVLADGKEKTKGRSCALVTGDENLTMSEAFMFRWLMRASSGI